MEKNVSASLEENISALLRLFGEDKSIKHHRFEPIQAGAQAIKCCMFCVDGMVNSLNINENIIMPVVTLPPLGQPVEDLLTFLEESVIQLNEARQSADMDQLIDSLLYGDTIVFCDGCVRALILGTKSFTVRGVSEPSGEEVIKGPREGFIEPLLPNLSMLRRKIKNPALKYEFFTVGDTTRTTCCCCYLEGVVDKQVLTELRRRLAAIDIDGIFDGNYLTEMITDGRFSPVKTVGSTERPDVVASKLLEGRVAVLVDGSPVAITVPHIFVENFHSAEDYYVSYPYAAINRVLRLVGFFLAISIAPVYVAFTTHNQEYLPTSLLLSIAEARQGVLLPTMVEAIVMLICFDLLREAGTRTPSSIGQTLSIVGGLVVGQAAVEARFVSAPMLIVIALSGITGLFAPKLKGAVEYIRIFLLLAVWLLGIYGFVMGFCALTLYMARMSSFGVPLLSNTFLAQTGSMEDSVARYPFFAMKRRGRFIAGGKDHK